MADDTLIGRRVRERRTHLGFTLRELAGKTDLTAAFLSQIENNQANPSISSLRRISEALGVSMLYFLDQGPKHNPVVRASERSSLRLAGSKVVYELLTPDLSRKMEVFLGKVGPKTKNLARKLREPTEECIFVMSGALLVELDSGMYILEEGDSIYFDGFSLINLSNASEQDDVRWLSVITPPVF